MTRKRQAWLVAEPTVEKAWAAVAVLSGFETWVSIDDIGDFLRMRQLDASAVKFDPTDPNTRYALQPRVTKWTRGWEDAVIAKALSDGVDQGFLELARRDTTNVFRAKKSPDSHWNMLNSSLPTSPTWALPRDAS